MEKRKQTSRLLPLLVVAIVVSGFTGTLKAQAPSYAYFDSLTYHLYLEEQWAELSAAGREAIELGHDGYYLQIRTGIAFFKRGQYRRADRYLTRARELSPNEVSDEYAYLAKRWGGRTLEADLLSASLTKSLLQRLGISPHPVIKAVGASRTTLFSDHEMTAAETGGPGEEAGSRLTANGFSHYSATLSHRMGRGVLTHEAGWLAKENVLYIGPSDLNESLWMDNYRTTQFNYYLRWEGVLGHHWNWQLFGNGLWFDYPAFGLSDRSLGNGRWAWEQSSDTGFDYVIGAGLTKRLDPIDLSLEVAGASMDGNGQIQTTASVYLYPFYNLRFYLGGRVIYNHSASDEQVLGGGTIGGRLADFLWLEGSALIADEARGFHLGQGNVVFNGTENVREIMGLHAIVFPWKRFKGVVSWQQRGYVSYFLPSESDDGASWPLKNKYQLISTSLLWTF